MRLTTKCHIKALRNTIELSLIASLTALIADLGWLIHDIHGNGLSVVYVSVGTGLIIGIVLTGFAVYNHHTGNVQCDIQEMYKKKLAVVRALNAKSKIDEIYKHDLAVAKSIRRSKQS